jgi:hypothetical protein
MNASFGKLLFAALAVLFTLAPAAAAERSARIARETFACVSWAAWREYVQASLSARGARPSEGCPMRIPALAKVTVVDEDAGAGAAEVRHRGRSWFVDADLLR